MEKQYEVQHAFQQKERSQQQRKRRHRQHRMPEHVHAGENVGQPHQQLPDHAACPMRVKSQHQVHDPREHDQPGNEHIHSDGRNKRRADRQSSKDHQQKAPDNGPSRSLPQYRSRCICSHRSSPMRLRRAHSAPREPVCANGLQAVSQNAEGRDEASLSSPFCC